MSQEVLRQQQWVRLGKVAADVRRRILHFRLRYVPKRRFGATAVRLVTSILRNSAMEDGSAATALATILELTLRPCSAAFI
jgi:hypothetical protein